MLSFKDKVVWVTGNVTGIGKATTLLFAELGAKVIVHEYNNADLADELEAELKGKGAEVLRVEGDVTDKLQVEEVVNQIKDHYGHIDVLVNNVGGLVKKGKLEELQEEDWDRVMDVNLKSVFLVTQAALPLLKEKGAKVVNFVSNVERHGGTLDTFAYTAAKGGVAALTRALAKQLIQYNISVNGVAPGLVDTPFHNVEGNTRDNFNSIFSKIPMKRDGSPEELAKVVLFLASDMSSYMLGEILEVSGGRRLS